MGVRPALAVLALLSAGCYTYTPMFSAPDPQMRVVLEINDAGRVAIEQTIGAETMSIEGVVQAINDSMIVLNVNGVKSLRGGNQRWMGEPVTIPRSYVRYVRERKYSGVRTFAVGTALAASTVAFLVTRNLLGTATNPGDGPPGPGPGEQ